VTKDMLGRRRGHLRQSVTLFVRTSLYPCGIAYRKDCGPRPGYLISPFKVRCVGQEAGGLRCPGEIHFCGLPPLKRPSFWACPLSS